MRLPKFSSLYGRIFAIFWFTIMLVVIAVLSLPHLDPRKVRDLTTEHAQRLDRLARNVENHYRMTTDLDVIIEDFNQQLNTSRHRKPSLYLVDGEGNILTQGDRSDYKRKVLKNFVSSTDLPEKAQQRLYGQWMLAGPVEVELANQQLQLYMGLRWNEPPPYLIRLFDKPFQLLMVVMAVSTPLLLWLAWALSQPARRLEQAARRVAKGEFVEDPKLEQGTREFRQAGQSFNQMVDAVNAMISGQQRLLSDISHELRSPLTRLRMASALAQRKQGESSELTRIDTEAQRLEQMISELLSLSRMQMDSHLSREQQPLSSLWEGLLDDAQFEAEQSGKALNFNAIPEQSISGNPKLLISALENVTRNAIRYADQVIQVHFSIEKESIVITVDDDGAGVPDDQLDQIFRPFYRVSTARDRDSGGTGLGLAITESAIRQHNGKIEAQPSPLGGLRVIISLPLS
ncbi:envelope stress sensor histidine kinase CpxA [Vibrio agarivorans]|uniref:histidine kinase n=1 Tax=Vibrio agarivorans TaxID=153622 RepID=A0ABT7Y2M6_9VIBR|nr:envelope stress sensor histidine kinase CpxA [Vibrio agarivorans]MDN2482252.1 envelope stress sensor histidine kinase CpxA [Vibrio agarivorans]